MSPSGVVGEDERHYVGGLVNGRYIYCSSSQQTALTFAHAVNMLLGETCTRIDARMCMYISGAGNRTRREDHLPAVGVPLSSVRAAERRRATGGR